MLRKIISMALALTLVASVFLGLPVFAKEDEAVNGTSDSLGHSVQRTRGFARTQKIKQTQGTNPEVPLKSWYTAPANDWESEALPLGNGLMGAMIFGGVDSDQIVLSESTLWSGGPGANPNYNGGHLGNATDRHASLQQARTKLQALMTDFTANHSAYIDETTGMIVAQNYPNNAEVNAHINDLKGTKENFGSYQELGSLYLENPDAIVPAIVRTWTSHPHKNPGGSEDIGSLFDGSKNTKYFADNPGTVPYTIEWDYAEEMPTKSYEITTGNDMAPRDPKNWSIYGTNTYSSDDTGWELIDTVAGEGSSLGGRRETILYPLDEAVSFQYYRMVVDDLYDNNQKLQMSELELLPHIENEVAEPTNYQRELDFDNAVSRVRYDLGDITHQREYFISYPDNIMAIELTASQTGQIDKFIRVGSAQSKIDVQYQNDTITMTGWPSDHDAQAQGDTNFENALHFAQKIKVIPTGGTVTDTSDGILVEDADSILILMAAGTNYQQCMDNTFDYFTGIDPMLAVNARITAAETQSFEELFQTHFADYHELFGRVDLQLMDANVSDKPTDQLLREYRRGNTASEDRYLEQLYYQFGRYLLISSSREGGLPANLQGVWVQGLNPPWSADYHTNINVQMNYWPAHQTNISETHVPLVTYVKSLVPRGEFTAQHGFVTPNGDPVRGWTIYHENNIWGNTAPAVSGAFFSPEDAAWMCQDIWEYYDFTRDEAFLQDNFQLLLDASLFWVDTLWEDERDGTLVANPSYSPEHGAYSLGATEVQAVIWDVFENTLAAGEILNIQSPELAEIKAAQDKLSPFGIGLGGQFMEWKDEVLMDITGDGGHRHVNHLYPLHPGKQIVAGRSAEEDAFVDAMKVTLNTRGDGGTGWSKGWKINFWARLRDGNRAHKLVTELLTHSTLSNLFDTHPPFQIDGNFGGTAGMTEMLLQSQGGIVELLAALPEAWSTGHVTGLKARGNVVIDMEWEDMLLSTATLTAGSDGPITLRSPNLSEANITSGGSEVSFTVEDQNTITIAMTAGSVYTIDSIPKGSASSLLISGPTDLRIPAPNNHTYDYFASIHYANGSVEENSSNVTWTLQGNQPQLSIDEQGVLTLAPYATSHSFYITALSKESPVSKTIEVTLTTGDFESEIPVRVIDRDDESAGSHSGTGKMQFSDDQVEYLLSGGWLKFENVDLHDGLEKIDVRYATPGTSQRTFEARIAEPGVGTVDEATTIGTTNFDDDTGGYQSFKSKSFSIPSEPSGVKDLYVTWNYPGAGFNLGNLTLHTKSIAPDLYDIVIDSSITGGLITSDKVVAEAGETVTLMIQPETGKRLVAGSLKFNTTEISGNSFTMPAEDVTITAEFEDIPPAVYNITVASLSGGSVTADKTSATAGETVTLTVTPSSGKRLVTDSLRFNNTVISGDTFTMPATDVTITAEFEDIPATLYSVSIGTLTGGTILPNKTTAPAGDTISLTIVPDTGKRLVAGSLKFNTTGISGNSFTMPAEDVTITAEFEDIPAAVYNITVASLSGGSVTADKTSATAGETVTLTVTPDSGKRLVTDSLRFNNTVISGDTFIMPAEDVTITAKFEEVLSANPITVLVTGEGTASATPTLANAGETVQLKATPAAEATFVRWDVVQPTTLTISDGTFVMPDEAVVLVAVFEGKHSPTPTPKPTPTPTPPSATSTSSSPGSSTPDRQPTAPTTEEKEWLVKETHWKESTAKENVAKVLESAKEKGIVPQLKMSGPRLLGKETLEQISAQLTPEQVLRLTVDSRTEDNRSVDVRMAFDLAGREFTEEITLSASTISTAASQGKALFERHFVGEFVVIDTSGTKGADFALDFAVKVPDSFTIDSLHFYHYNKETNSYVLTEATNPWKDSNGYLHFSVVPSAFIIITDGAIEKR